MALVSVTFTGAMFTTSGYPGRTAPAAGAIALRLTAKPQIDPTSAAARWRGDIDRDVGSAVERDGGTGLILPCVERRLHIVVHSLGQRRLHRACGCGSNPVVLRARLAPLTDVELEHRRFKVRPARRCAQYHGECLHYSSVLMDRRGRHRPDTRPHIVEAIEPRAPALIVEL
ncbi:MAG: hypothetical protein ACYDA6_03055 [Solirubrobacteraceae bacterium]